MKIHKFSNISWLYLFKVSAATACCYHSPEFNSFSAHKKPGMKLTVWPVKTYESGNDFLLRQQNMSIDMALSIAYLMFGLLSGSFIPE